MEKFAMQKLADQTKTAKRQSGIGWRLLIPRPLTMRAEREAQDRFDVRLASRALSPAETIAAARAHSAQAMIIGSDLSLDRSLITDLPGCLRVVATTGIGLDHIDLTAASERGITVRNVPAIGSEDTADLTLMLMLMACRRAHEYDVLMRAGWVRRLGYGEMLGLRVTGRRLGIVGMGAIGQLVADRARGFGMNVVYHQRNVAPGRDEVFFSNLDEMLPQIDTLTLHVPETEVTRGLISAERLARLPQGAILVNTARGGLVDEAALIAALDDGHLAGAGLDVFCGEPSPASRLLALPNVALTPHVGSATHEARDGIALQCLDMIEEVLQSGTKN